MKKSYILIILISFLVISPKLYAQVECPCNFESVPKDTDCWVIPFNADFPIYGENLPVDGLCHLFSLAIEPSDATQLIVDTDQSECHIINTPFKEECIVASSSAFNLTPEQLMACQCELLAYTTALNDGGISVSPGPPYECMDVDCRQVVPSPIPTFNQWGLIALAVILGIIGIVGFMVIRRRKATA